MATLAVAPFVATRTFRALRRRNKMSAWASVKDDALVLHPYVNLAIAVDLGADGLGGDPGAGAAGDGVVTRRLLGQMRVEALTPRGSGAGAAKNEEENILNCLRSLSELDYPKEKLEIILQPHIIFIANILLQEEGRIDEARQCFERAHWLAPDDRAHGR